MPQVRIRGQKRCFIEAFRRFSSVEWVFTQQVPDNSLKAFQNKLRDVSIDSIKSNVDDFFSSKGQTGLRRKTWSRGHAFSAAEASKRYCDLFTFGSINEASINNRIKGP